MLHTPVTSAPNAFASCTAIGANAAGRTEDQDPLAWLDATDVGQGLQSGERRRSERLRPATKLRFAGLGASLSSRRGRVLGEGAVGDAEHLVAGREPRDRGSDRHDGAGDVESGYPVLRGAEPETEQSEEVRLAGHHVPGPAVQPRRLDVNEHFVIGDLGPRDLGEAQDVGGAVRCPGRSRASCSR